MTKQPFLNKIILYCLYKLNGDRTVSSVFHLLNGKKSSQTLQDIRLFGLSSFFKTFEPVSRPVLDIAVETLAESGLIEEISSLHYTVTEQGREEAGKLFSDFPFLTLLNGWKYQNTEVFWEKLSLLVQVASNLVHGVTSYVPVQKNADIQKWIKDFLRRQAFNRRKLGVVLYNELEAALASCRYVHPSVVTIRLTGSDFVGLTLKQAAKVLEMEETLYHYQFLALLHHLLGTAGRNPREFPVLTEISGGFDRKFSLTNSTRITMNLLAKGLSLDEIAYVRGLKISTIRDHVVELALNVDGFDISPYMDKKTEQAIISAAKRASSKQLKQIRSLVEHADYFQIRLVMAKYGDELFS